MEDMKEQAQETTEEAKVVEKVVEQETKPLEDKIDYKSAYLKEKADKDNVLSRLGKLEKEAKARMTEEQIRAEELAEQAAETERMLKEYQKREAIATIKSNFLAKGFKELDANEAAEAMHGGDFAKVIDLVGKYGEMLVKAEKEKLLNSTPQPLNGITNKGGSPFDSIAKKYSKK